MIVTNGVQFDGNIGIEAIRSVNPKKGSSEEKVVQSMLIGCDPVKVTASGAANETINL
jgi:hypothetical protein